MKKLSPNMAVKDVRKAVEYYVENFGFKLAMAFAEDRSNAGDELADDKEYIWAMVDCEGVSFMFQRVDSIKEDIGDFFDTLGSSVSFYIEVEDVDALYNTVKDSVKIHKDIETTDYGMREFYVKDLNNYILAFSQQML